MKVLSLDEAINSSVCKRCEAVEVLKEGDICGTCRIILNEGGRDMAVTDAPIITAEEPGKPGVPIFSLPESTGLPCKGGCGDRVVTHKGIGGWCTKNGCRQKEIDRRKAEGTWNVSSHSRQPKRKKKSKRLVSDATKVALPKLDEITFKSLAHMENQIKIACARVREAEDELGTRRNDLKAILEAAAKYA